MRNTGRANGRDCRRIGRTALPSGTTARFAHGSNDHVQSFPDGQFIENEAVKSALHDKILSKLSEGRCTSMLRKKTVVFND
jgi:hypothetical protein